MLSKIFISYARVDETFARQLASRLSIIGAKPWLDVLDIPLGMNWSTAIQRGLDEANLMLLIVTPESMKSDNVTNEWQYFLDEKKPIIPILLKPAKQHFQLARMQYVDFYKNTFDNAFKRLQTELRRKGLQVKPFISDTPTLGNPRTTGAVAADVEKVLTNIGLDVGRARLSTESGYGWTFRQGSTILEVYISTQNDVNYFQVLSPLLQMPPGKCTVTLYQRLLELNLQLTSATLGVYLDIVYLFSEMKLSGLDQARIQNAIIQMAAYANELDSKLVAEFGGKLYSEMSPSP